MTIKITIAILFCIATQYLYSATPITIWPYEIKFNYETGNNNDALKIKSGYNTDVPIPEWKYNGGNAISEKFAYIKAQPKCSIQVRFDSNCPDNMHLIIKLITIGDGIGNVCNYFISNYTKLNFVELILQPTIPNSVGKRNFTWQWEIYAMPANVGTYCAATSFMNTTHIYYTLLSTPQLPMSEPWTGVLDKACDWASGQSTDSNVLSNLTSKLYTQSGLVYDGMQSHYDSDIKPNYTKYIFNLTGFLNEWDKADCQDVSMFLSILSSSIGASLTQTMRIGGFFCTKSIKPIGKGWSNADWAFHQIGWLNNVYDPCLMLNSNPSLSYIPINKNIDDPYKIDLVDNNCENNWSPKSAFRLGEIDPVKYVLTEIH